MPIVMVPLTEVNSVNGLAVVA
jgi:hypothetical protein